MDTKNINAPINYKSTDLETKANDTTRIVSGYFASFGTLDADNDIIVQGAFAKSLAERGVNSTGNRKIKYLHQHRVDEIAGSLLELREDALGLYFEAKTEKTPLGDVILERYKNGTYNEHSIGFQYVAGKCDFVKIEGKDIFECKELNLFEGSVVTFGSNSQTPFAGFKGSNDELKRLMEDEYKFMIKSAPTYEYELRLRQYYVKQLSLIEALAERNSLKQTIEPKPELDKVKSLDYNYLITTLKNK